MQNKRRQYEVVGGSALLELSAIGCCLAIVIIALLAIIHTSGNLKIWKETYGQFQTHNLK